MRRHASTPSSGSTGSSVTGAEREAPVRVAAHAGSRADETPRRFTVGTRTVEVVAVLDRWREPEHAYFAILGDDGVRYRLRHDVGQDRWDVPEHEADG